MNGWIAAITYLLIVGFANIFWKLSADMGLHPAVYVSQGMMAGSLTLLIFSKGGKLGIETFLHLNTWLYGIFFFIGGILSVIALQFVDAFTDLLLSRISLIFTFMMTWTFIARPNKVLSHFILLIIAAIGLYMLSDGLPVESRVIVLICAFGLGFMNSLRALLVQTHTPNNKARTFVEEIRVTAIVMAVTGLLSYALISLAAVLNTYAAQEVSSSLPQVKDLFNETGIVIAAIYGTLCFSSMRYLEFYSIKRIGSLRFMAMMTFLPLSALIFELICSYFDFIPMRQNVLNFNFIMAFALIVFSSLGILYIERGKFKSKNFKASIKQREKDRDLAQYAMNRNKGDRVKTAEMLNISEHALASALGETDEDLTPEISQKLQENFTHHMAFIDSLTGLMNRSKFMQQLEEILNKKTKGVLVYLDLDKFKPINDTHGHAVGDAVLRIVSQRFRQHIRGTGFASRLGGDEFACVMTKGDEKSVKALIKSIEAPIQIDGIDEPLKVGASSGVISLPAKGKTAEEVLDQADKRMYENKKGR